MDILRDHWPRLAGKQLEELKALMWTKPAAQSDLKYLCNVDVRLGVKADRSDLFRASIASGGCFLAGFDQSPQACLVSSISFFSRPFVSLLFVDETARRKGLGRALLDKAETRYIDQPLYVSTNQSNAVMQTVLSKRQFLPAGVILYLDPGDPELLFVKLPNSTD